LNSVSTHSAIFQAGPDGQPLSHAQVIRNVVDEGVLADQSGVFCIGLGKHHWPDFAISSPEALLAVIGARTKHIRLASSLYAGSPETVARRIATTA
jgi:alkanesulfonate monooxygenase SsuD/methylene tetrahydromethanopterin reductase-like flavin-dependent oxidoreductase (luciferase family)